MRRSVTIKRIAAGENRGARAWCGPRPAPNTSRPPIAPISDVTSTTLRQSVCPRNAAKYDDAIATLDKVIAMPGVDAAIVNYAKSEKEKAVKAKGAK